MNPLAIFSNGLAAFAGMFCFLWIVVLALCGCTNGLAYLIPLVGIAVSIISTNSEKKQ